MPRGKQDKNALRDRIIAGTCLAISEVGPRPSIHLVLRRSRAGRASFYAAFDRLEGCVKGSLSHSLDEVFRCIDAGGDWANWVAGHRAEAAVVAWGFAIDADAIETAIDRAAGMLPMDRTTAVGVVGGIYTSVGARLRAGESLDPATVRALEDFVDRYRLSRWRRLSRRMSSRRSRSAAASRS